MNHYTEWVEKNFDVIVIGLGAMGSAAAYKLAKRGQRVLGIDQFDPPHTLGSSHGESRIIRQAIGEGKEYVPLVLRAYELFREIERDTGTSLLVETGGLIIADPSDDSGQHGVQGFLQATVATAEEYNIPHTVLDNAQLKKRFPQFSTGSNEMGYYEPGAGFLRPERCIESQLQLAEKYGATLHRNERVLSFAVGAGNDRVTVTTDKGKYEAGKLALCAGPWIGQLLKQDAALLKIFRQVLFWFEVQDSIEPYLPGNFPIFIWTAGKDIDLLYGFPALEGSAGGVKVATEQYETTVDSPEQTKRDVSLEEIVQMQRHVVEFLPALSGKCIKAESCLYTVTPDSRFIIDAHPAHPNVIVASPCSGHGFKHSAAIGEVIAQLVTEGKSAFDIRGFGFDRFK